MATKATRPEGAERILAPTGTHIARIYRFMNLGTRVQEYKGQPKDYPDTLIDLTWELPEELHEFKKKDEETGEKKPIVVSREFTLSMGAKSNLRPIVEGIIGTTLTDEEAYNFDLEQLVGMPCLVTISHKESASGNKYARIVSTAPLMKGQEAPEPFNEKIIFNVNTATKEEIEALPEFLRNKIYESDEFKDRFDREVAERRKEIGEEIEKRRGATKASEEITENDIPF